MTPPYSQARATARTTRYPRWGRGAKSESAMNSATSVRPPLRRTGTERGQSSDVRRWKSSVFRSSIPRSGAAGPSALLFGRRRRLRGRLGRLRRFQRRVGGPEVAVAGWALPELLRRPRLPGAGVPQLHRGAAPLATNRDIGMVHGRNCSVPFGRVATRPGGARLPAGMRRRRPVGRSASVADRSRPHGAGMRRAGFRCRALPHARTRRLAVPFTACAGKRRCGAPARHRRSRP